jgi:hypothetical protein
VYDPLRVGFIHDGEKIEPLHKRGLVFEFQTVVPGNGNGGHEGEDFGTRLTAAQKGALLEYLKTQ